MTKHEVHTINTHTLQNVGRYKQAKQNFLQDIMKYDLASNLLQSLTKVKQGLTFFQLFLTHQLAESHLIVM